MRLGQWQILFKNDFLLRYFIGGRSLFSTCQPHVGWRSQNISGRRITILSIDWWCRALLKKTAIKSIQTAKMAGLFPISTFKDQLQCHVNYEMKSTCKTLEENYFNIGSFLKPHIIKVGGSSDWPQNSIDDSPTWGNIKSRRIFHPILNQLYFASKHPKVW